MINVCGVDFYLTVCPIVLELKVLKYGTRKDNTYNFSKLSSLFWNIVIWIAHPTLFEPRQNLKKNYIVFRNVPVFQGNSQRERYTCNFLRFRIQKWTSYTKPFSPSWTHIPSSFVPAHKSDSLSHPQTEGRAKLGALLFIVDRHAKCLSSLSLVYRCLSLASPNSLVVWFAGTINLP